MGKKREKTLGFAKGRKEIQQFNAHNSIYPHSVGRLITKELLLTNYRALRYLREIQKVVPKLNPHPRGWTLLERQWIGSNTGDTMPKYGKVKARADEYKHEGDDSLVTANNS